MSTVEVNIAARVLRGRQPYDSLMNREIAGLGAMWAGKLPQP